MRVFVVRYTSRTLRDLLKARADILEASASEDVAMDYLRGILDCAIHFARSRNGFPPGDTTGNTGLFISKSIWCFTVFWMAKWLWRTSAMLGVGLSDCKLAGGTCAKEVMAEYFLTTH